MSLGSRLLVSLSTGSLSHGGVCFDASGFHCGLSAEITSFPALLAALEPCLAQKRLLEKFIHWGDK